MKLSSFSTQREFLRGPLGPGLRLALGLLTGLGASASDSPKMTITPSVLLDWPDPGLETQVVVASSSLTAIPRVWQPLLEPVFSRLGAQCCAVPIATQEQFFQLKPGFQFIDDANGTAGPWPFEPFPSGNEGVTLTHTNGAVRVQVAAGKKEALYLWPAGAPGTFGEVSAAQPHTDFACSIDIVAWPNLGEANLWIQGRSTRPPEFAIATAFIDFDGGAARRLTVYLLTPRGEPEKSVPCSMTRGKVYRLTLHGIGDQYTGRLWQAGTPDKLVATVSLTSTLIPRGDSVSAGVYTGFNALDVTLDNFRFSGVRPFREEVSPGN